MSTSKRFRLVASLVFGLALLGLVVLGLSLTPAPPVDAQTLIGTPQLTSFGGGDWAMVPYFNAEQLSGTLDCSSGQQTAAYVDADLQHITVMDSAAEDLLVISCTMQFSNDNTNWCVGVYTVTAVTTDTIGCDRISLFGRYSRICCVGSESEEIYTMTQRAKVFN